eukprot:TRINITY_DN9735_c0_g1_i1.p1 TRINITY_DN9735_c0_g1~~TRINITY_DN9735_c0_g1_i1.p1  ORF type:complete len:204 (-),score=-18.65 TRINITY_DN9735_c0_g1_i1:291-902(-)
MKFFFSKTFLNTIIFIFQKRTLTPCFRGEEMVVTFRNNKFQVCFFKGLCNCSYDKYQKKRCQLLRCQQEYKQHQRKSEQFQDQGRAFYVSQTQEMLLLLILWILFYYYYCYFELYRCNRQCVLPIEIAQLQNNQGYEDIQVLQIFSIIFQVSNYHLELYISGQYTTLFKMHLNFSYQDILYTLPRFISNLSSRQLTFTVPKIN